MRKRIKKLLPILFLLFVIPLTVWLALQVQEIRKRAGGGEPANIIIDAQKSLGILPRLWENLAQGGEKNTDLNQSIIKEKIPPFNIKYIRIDHLYGTLDGNQIVIAEGQYNWEPLDKRIAEILALGAKPLLSLSYMPQAISGGDHLSTPTNWGQWQRVIKDTIEHFSGKIDNVYYEVWNEPDHSDFGAWNFSSKNYLLLYKYAVLGANAAKTTHPFKIGGPGVADPLRCVVAQLPFTSCREFWIKGFLDFVALENLRLDFVSWHRYHKRISQFVSDIESVDSWILESGLKVMPEKLITEWGSDPGNHVWHDSSFDTGHIVYGIAKMTGKVDKAFFFEIRDGILDDGAEIPGRWGIFDHSGRVKDKYFAFDYLSKLQGERLDVGGEGSFVGAIATKNNDEYQVLVSYDPVGVSLNQGLIPLSFINLPVGKYEINYEGRGGVFPTAQEKGSLDGKLSTQVTLLPGSFVLITVKKTGDLYSFEPAKYGQGIVQNEKVLPLTLTLPSIFTGETGTVKIIAKANINNREAKKEVLIEIPLTTDQVIGIYKQPIGFAQGLAAGIFLKDKEATPVKIVSGSVTNWKNEEFNEIIFSWSKNSLSLILNGKVIAEERDAKVIIRGQATGLLYLCRRLDGSLTTPCTIDELAVYNRIVTAFNEPPPYQLETGVVLLRHFEGNNEK